jgi:hypothetical protein
VHLQSVLRARGGTLAPERVDQLFAGNRAVRLEREREQYFALIAAGNWDLLASAPNFERAEKLVLEPNFDGSASFDRP